MNILLLPAIPELFEWNHKQYSEDFMLYHYLAFGILLFRDELSALLPLKADSGIENPVYVKLGTVPEGLLLTRTKADYFTYCNADEMIYTLPEK